MPGRLIAAAREHWGRLDGALISVGGPPTGTVTSTTDDEWRASFAAVFLGGVRTAREVAAELGEGGSIAFVLSTSVKGPLTEMAVSNGLRPGLAMVAKQLADELGPRGIRVNGLLPGRVGTERVAELDALQGDPAAAKARAAEHIPLRRDGEPSGVRPCRGVPAQPRRVVRHRRHAARRRRCDAGALRVPHRRRPSSSRAAGRGAARRDPSPPPRPGSRTRTSRAGRRTTTGARRRSAGPLLRSGSSAGSSGVPAFGVLGQQVDEAAVHAGSRSPAGSARWRSPAWTRPRPGPSRRASRRTQPVTVTRPAGGAGTSGRVGETLVGGRVPAAVDQQRRTGRGDERYDDVDARVAFAGPVADHDGLAHVVRAGRRDDRVLRPRTTDRCRWRAPRSTGVGAAAWLLRMMALFAFVDGRAGATASVPAAGRRTRAAARCRGTGAIVG